MPLSLTVDHPNRLVVALGGDEVTLADLAQLAQEMIRQKMLGHALMLNVAATQRCFEAREFVAFAKLLRASCQGKQRPGPLAIVTDPYGDLFDELYNSSDMPALSAQVFRSIHEAKRWLSLRTPPHGWEPAQRRPDFYR